MTLTISPSASAAMPQTHVAGRWLHVVGSTVCLRMLNSGPAEIWYSERKIGAIRALSSKDRERGGRTVLEDLF